MLDDITGRSREAMKTLPIALFAAQKAPKTGSTEITRVGTEDIASGLDFATVLSAGTKQQAVANSAEAHSKAAVVTGTWPVSLGIPQELVETAAVDGSVDGVLPQANPAETPAEDMAFIGAERTSPTPGPATASESGRTEQTEALGSNFLEPGDAGRDRMLAAGAEWTAARRAAAPPVAGFNWTAFPASDDNRQVISTPAETDSIPTPDVSPVTVTERRENPATQSQPLDEPSPQATAASGSQVRPSASGSLAESEPSLPQFTTPSRGTSAPLPADRLQTIGAGRAGAPAMAGADRTTPSASDTSVSMTSENDAVVISTPSISGPSRAPDAQENTVAPAAEASDDGSNTDGATASALVGNVAAVFALNTPLPSLTTLPTPEATGQLASDDHSVAEALFIPQSLQAGAPQVEGTALVSAWTSTPLLPADVNDGQAMVPLQQGRRAEKAAEVPNALAQTEMTAKDAPSEAGQTTRVPLQTDPLNVSANPAARNPEYPQEQVRAAEIAWPRSTATSWSHAIAPTGLAAINIGASDQPIYTHIPQVRR